MEKEQLKEILVNTPGFNDFMGGRTNTLDVVFGFCRFRLTRRGDNNKLKWEILDRITEEENSEINDIISLLAETAVGL